MTNDLLAEFLSAVCGGFAKTTIADGVMVNALVLEQENCNSRDDEENEDDMIVLDEPSQRTLYAILHARFGV